MSGKIQNQKEVIEILLGNIDTNFEKLKVEKDFSKRDKKTSVNTLIDLTRKHTNFLM